MNKTEIAVLIHFVLWCAASVGVCLWLVVKGLIR